MSTAYAFRQGQFIFTKDPTLYQTIYFQGTFTILFMAVYFTPYFFLNSYVPSQLTVRSSPIFGIPIDDLSVSPKASVFANNGHNNFANFIFNIFSLKLNNFLFLFNFSYFSSDSVGAEGDDESGGVAILVLFDRPRGIEQPE